MWHREQHAIRLIEISLFYVHIYIVHLEFPIEKQVFVRKQICRKALSLVVVALQVFEFFVHRLLKSFDEFLLEFV